MKLLLPIALSFLAVAQLLSAPPQPSPLNDFLQRGQLNEALAAYAKPHSDAERFSLAAAQVLDGVREFSAGFNQLSLHPNLRNTPLPFFRVVIQDAASGPPHTATPAAVAELFLKLKSALRRANDTLGSIEGKEEFAVRINLSEGRLDFSGDGQINRETETLQAAFGRVLGVNAVAAQGPLIVQFDQADAAWLKGYTYFLVGVLDLISSYDWSPVWNQCAHRLFMMPDPMPAIAKVQGQQVRFEQFPDYIAAIHDMRLDLVDPQGPRRARDSFLLMIEQSRICWQRALAEKDDVNEWLPNPNQKGPGGATVTREQIDGWSRILDELEAVARGKKLLPHWQLKPSVGINLDQLVTAPPKLDLVLWLQGSAFLPYVQEGEVSNSGAWRELQRPFGPGFIQFALWSN